MKRWLIMIGSVTVMIVVIGGIWGFNVSRKIAAYKAMGVPKQTVTTMRAEATEWSPVIATVGSLQAVRGVDLSAEIAGVIDTIHFESGLDVKQGDLLIEMRANDEIGKLASLRANGNLAERNYRRARAQFEAKAISEAEFDAEQAKAMSAEGEVAEQQAIVEKKRLRAPFSGHLGIRNVDVGQYVVSGTKIVTLQTLDPIYADFFVPQRQISAIKVGQSITVSNDSFPGQTFSGSVSAIETKVDAATRNIQVRAMLKNPQHQLLPGMYVNLKIDAMLPNTEESKKQITLPQTAVAYNPYGATVFLVTTAKDLEAAGGAAVDAKIGPDSIVAKQVFVTTGQARGDQVTILNGVGIGDEVVTSGQLKIKNGTPLIVNNSELPTNDLNPNPIEE